MKVSNCCGVSGNGYVLSYEQRELCPKCGEHCEYVEEEETQNTALMELLNYINAQYKINGELNYSYIKPKATELLQKERKQIEEAFLDAINRGDDISPSTARSLFEDYYNKTYKS